VDVVDGTEGTDKGLVHAVHYLLSRNLPFILACGFSLWYIPARTSRLSRFHFITEFKKMRSLDKARQRIEAVEMQCNTRASRWKISTDRQSWQEYEPGQQVQSASFALETEFPLQGLLAHARFDHESSLTIRCASRGFSRVVTQIGESAPGIFTVDGAQGTLVEVAERLRLPEKPGESVKIRLEVENLGFCPARGDCWPPRKAPLLEEGLIFVLQEAELGFPDLEPRISELKDWALSMRTADRLLDPEFFRYTFTGNPFPIPDGRRVCPDRLARLRETWISAVLELDCPDLGLVDWKSLSDALCRSYQVAGALREYAKEFEVSLIGNAHIDVAWLWRIPEAMAVARNTFRTVLQNMDEYPELVYAQSQAISYDWMEKNHPQVFEGIRRRFNEGRWEIVGGMWVEPDCNLISGESWIRQIVYGKRYFREKFGHDVRIGWNPDSFGYNWNMPQIYRKSGIDCFITQKLWWNDTTVFPHFAFWWEGVDGTRLFTFFPPVGYNSAVQLNEVADAITKYEADTGHKKSLILYGLGDHGGGPNREILDRVRRYQELFIAPEFRHSTAAAFLHQLEEEVGSELPVWNDELYLEYHRGTYTTQGQVKKDNRALENLISSAEKMAAMAHFWGNDYPRERLEEAWKILLTNQFHDILPGSSITPVYRDAREASEQARAKIERVLLKSLSALAARIDTSAVAGAPLIVFNPLAWPRKDVVSFQLPMQGRCGVRVMDCEGREMPVEVSRDEQEEVLEVLLVADVPALGYRVYSVVYDVEVSRPDAPLAVRGLRLENGIHRLEVDAQSGNIKSLFDKRLQKEFVAEGKECNLLRLYEDRPEQFDAWEILYTGRVWELDQADSVKLLSLSPVRAVIEVKKSFLGLSKTRREPTEDFPSSFFTQRIVFYADLDRVDIQMEADWWEDHVLLKAEFPVTVDSDCASYEIPFAAIRRSARSETLWDKARHEVPALKWADLSEETAGISVLNDSKYGYDIHDGVIRLSLLRSPTEPDPLADRGRHAFSYSLYTHPGDWTDSETVKRAAELNSPLLVRVTDRHHGELPPFFSFFRVESESVILDTVKVAEEGDELILRLYESKGRASDLILHSCRPIESVQETDLLEKEIAQLTAADCSLRLTFQRFEIRTLKVKIEGGHGPEGGRYGTVLSASANGNR
jgi:alpha-mannosidase